LKKRILFFSCLLAGISIVLTAGLIHFAVYRNLSENQRIEAAKDAAYIAAAVELSGERYLKSLGPVPRDLRITLIRPDGAVLFDSEADAERMENHRDRPEIKAAIESGVGKGAHFSRTLSKQTFYHATRLANGNVLRVASATDSVFVSFLRLIFITLAIAAFVFAVAAIIGSRVTRLIVEPINRLNLDEPEENAVYDELTPLLSRMKRQNDTIAEQMREIRHKQIEFSAITDNMREGLLVLDRDARVLSCNASATALLRARVSNPIHRNALEWSRSEPFYRAVTGALDGMSTQSVAKSDEKYIQIMANPVKDAGNIQGVVVVLLDVTERENREILRREFTANVSHELKTPLTAISGYAEIISNGVAKTEDIPVFAGKILGEAQRLISLIGDIMMLAKLDEDDGLPPREVIDLKALLEDAIARLSESSASQRGVTIAFDGEPVEIRGTRRILDEIVMNVLDNAIKYNVEGGSVEVLLEKTASMAVLSVTDTGIGIPPGEQERIFERFYRVDKSRSSVIEGTGLGLSIVKHGVKLHGGEINLRSETGVGTTITLKLPRHDKPFAP
jgi:two-component system phosphate regulon sensor histidine kinase PhoR